MYLLLNWQLVCRMREMMQGFRVSGLNGEMNWSCLLPRRERLQGCKIRDVFEYCEIEMIISYADGYVSLLVAHHSVEFRWEI